MFALTPIVFLVLALTAGGTAALAEHQDKEAEPVVTPDVETVARPAADQRPECGDDASRLEQAHCVGVENEARRGE